jgi:hypothetical protein
MEDIVAANGRLTVPDLVGLLLRDINDAHASPESLTEELYPQRYGIDRLRHQLASLVDGGMAYSIAIKLLTSVQDAWYFLSSSDKERMTSFAHIFNSLCCPMPRHRAVQMLELADVGQLAVVRGLKSVARNADCQFTAIAEDHPPIQFDRVFSAGFDGNRPDPMAQPLITGLINSGHGRAHPFGGLDVDRTTSRLIDANNQP